MNPLDRLIAWAQIAITALLVIGVVAIVVMLEVGLASKLSPDEQKIFSQSMRWLEDVAFMALGFWFQRLRAGGVPEGPTITHTQTSPDGTVSSIKYPANMPAPKPPDPTPPARPPSGKA